MDDIEQKAKKSLEDYNSFPRMDIEDVYAKSQLCPDEIKVLEEFRDILEHHLVHYAPKWLFESPELNSENLIKYISSTVAKCREHNVVGDIRNFLSTLFYPSMDYNYSLTENGYRVGPKSNQFYDILFELDILDFLLDRKFKIDLDNVNLCNGKKAEFWAQDASGGFYVEAKNIPSNDLHEIIYSKRLQPNRASGSFSLNEEQEREIRERFKKQYKNAQKKFKNLDVKHGIFINLNLPLGVLGEKLQTYINKLINSKHSEHLVTIGIFTSNKIYFYNCSKHSLETIQSKNEKT